MKKIICILIASSLLTACSLFNMLEPENTKDGLIIKGSLSQQNTRSTTAVESRSTNIDLSLVNQLKVIRIEKGNDSVIFPGTVLSASTFDISDDGSFIVDLGENVVGNYVLALLNTNLEEKKDHIVGFISIPVDDTTGALILPLNGETGTLDLGQLTESSQNEISSEADIDDISALLESASIEQMRSSADFDNSVKMLINDYINVDFINDSEGNSSYYTSEVSLNYSGPNVENLWNNSAQITNFTLNGLSLKVYSHDNSTNMQFVLPDGTKQSNSGNFGEGSATKWEYSTNNSEIQSGWWKVINFETDEVLGIFDFGLSFPTNTDGTVISPYMIPKFILDENQDIAGIDFNWFILKDGIEIKITDPDTLEVLIGKQEFNIQFNNDNQSITYMYDEIRGDQQDSRMYGDLTSVELDNSVSATDFKSISLGCRFGFYRIFFEYPEL